MLRKNRPKRARHGDPPNVSSQLVDVTIKDETAPVLTLLGPNPMALELGTPYTEPGATAADACAGDLTDAVVITGAVEAGWNSR